MAENTPVTPTATPAAPQSQPDEGFLHSLATSAGIDPEAVVATAKAIRQHPWQVAKDVGSAQVGEFVDAGHHLRETAKSALQGVASAITNPEAKAQAVARLNSPDFMQKLQGAAEYATAAIPLIGGGLVKSEEQAGAGNIPGSLGTLTGVMAPIVTETEGAQGLKTHLAETGRTFVESAKEGLQRASVAQAPENSLEAGFAKIGGKKVRGATPKSPEPVAGKQNAAVGFINPDGKFEEFNSKKGKNFGDESTHEDFARNRDTSVEDMKNEGWVRKAGQGSYDVGELNPKTKAAIEHDIISDYSDLKNGNEYRRPVESIVIDTAHGTHEIPIADFIDKHKGDLDHAMGPDTTKFAAIGGKFVGKTPEPVASEYHPDLQKVIDLPGVNVHQDPSQVTEAAHFVTPDGKFVRLPAGLDHDAAINQVRPEQREYDPRINFINDTGAVRIRPLVDKAGPTIHVSVPEKGVTPEQADALKQSVGQGMKSRGNLVLETAAATPQDIKTETQEMVSPRHIDDMLQKIGPSPTQKKTEEAPKAAPNLDVQTSAQKYAKAKGMPEISHGETPLPTQEERNNLADRYEAASHAPTRPKFDGHMMQ